MRRLAVGMVLLVGATTAAIAPTAAAHAAPACATSWAAPVSGRWDDAAKWTNGLPTTVACIDVPGNYTVSVRDDAFADAVRLGATSGRQVIDVAGTCARDAALSLGTDSGESVIGRHGVLRVHDRGCNAGANVESDLRLLNRGLIDVEADAPTATRHFYGNFVNHGTLRVGGAAQLEVSGGIFSARAATLQILLVTPTRQPSLNFQYQDRVIPHTIDVLVDPVFVPTRRTSWTVCSNCVRHATEINGTQLPNGFEIVFHFRRSPQLASSWVEATIRRARAG